LSTENLSDLVGRELAILPQANEHLRFLHELAGQHAMTVLVNGVNPTEQFKLADGLHGRTKLPGHAVKRFVPHALFLGQSIAWAFPPSGGFRMFICLIVEPNALAGSPANPPSRSTCTANREFPHQRRHDRFES